MSREGKYAIVGGGIMAIPGVLSGSPLFLGLMIAVGALMAVVTSVDDE